MKTIYTYTQKDENGGAQEKRHRCAPILKLLRTDFHSRREKNININP